VTRAARLAAAILLFGATAARGEAGETILVLPFRAIGVGDTTVAAVRAILSGELELRGFTPVSPVAEVAPPSAEGGCDQMDCALLEAERAGADRVVYGTLSRLGEKITVRAHAARAGELSPYLRDQLTATAEGDLPFLIEDVADGVASGEATAGRTSAAPTGARAPRLGFAGGIVFPMSDAYNRASHLTSLRLYLRQKWGRTFLEMGVPVAGIAWSGDFASSGGESRTIDWTIYDLYLGKAFGTERHAAQLGAGLGLHLLDFTRSVAIPEWSPVPVDCGGDCGGAEGLALTGEVGFGVNLVDGRNGELNLSIRIRATLIPTDMDDALAAHGVLLQLGAIL